MDVEAQIHLLTQTANKQPQDDQEIYISALVMSGVSRSEALDTYRLTQIAFGCRLLSELGVKLPDGYWRFTEKGKYLTTASLSASRHFQAAQTRSYTLLSKAVIDTLALTSPEVKAVNDLMSRGSKAADIALAPVVLMEGTPDETAMKRVGIHMTNYCQARREQTKKPW